MATITNLDAFRKSPTEVLDYLVQWGDWLAGDSIVSDSFSADAGITIDSSADEGDNRRVWLSGGTLGERYCVTNQIVTATRTAEYSFYIDCVKR